MTLYVEGPTDLAILRAFAKTLNHEKALKALERPFVHYVGNQPNNVRKHFYGLEQCLGRKVCVTLGHGNGVMTQQVTNAVKVNTSHYQPTRKIVPQIVKAKADNPGFFHQSRPGCF